MEPKSGIIVGGYPGSYGNVFFTDAKTLVDDAKRKVSFCKPNSSLNSVKYRTDNISLICGTFRRRKDIVGMSVVKGVSHLILAPLSFCQFKALTISRY